MFGHMEGGILDVVADNPGARWLFHCHNLYHHMAGMATELRYG
jgi:FtsP/CotA-like multicopper oxidase with cupredoxin domain